LSLSECAGEAGRKRYYACVFCRDRLFNPPGHNGIADAKRWADLSAEDLEFAMWVKRRARCGQPEITP
jgi:hypothetical protein